MPRLRLRTLVAGVVLAAITLTTAPTDASAVPTASPPRVMAAAGDSITRAFNVDWCCLLSDSPSRSWSTGTNAAIDSHYQRLQRFAPNIGAAYNNARSGARMAELPGQLAAAAAQRADYVTVLMGANDVCTPSAATMTPTSTFEAQLRQALETFTAARPRAAVFVASVPDVYRLWQLFRSNPIAVFIWSTFNICQSMLSTSNTEQVRQQVVARLVAFNEVLARVCGEFRQCRWDGHAVYDSEYSAADVSSIDFFHPSVQGQRRLAAVTWAASFWPNKG